MTKEVLRGWSEVESRQKTVAGREESGGVEKAVGGGGGEGDFGGVKGELGSFGGAGNVQRPTLNFQLPMAGALRGWLGWEVWA
jgi:hypothetical protein